MTGPVFHRLLQRGILRAASGLVPASNRAEWLREWRAELWQSRAGTGISSQAERKRTRICLGSLQDALCLRRLAWQEGEPVGLPSNSALQCLAWLMAALLVSYGLSVLLPGVRTESHPSQYKVRSGLILIQSAGSIDDSVATISAQNYRLGLRGGNGISIHLRSIGSHTTPFPRVRTQSGGGRLHTQPDLFSILGLPVRLAARGGLPGVVLSDATWRREFGSDRRIAGRVIRVRGREARVVGVAPEGVWRMPGHVDAWFLEPDTQNAGVGYMIAHLSELGASSMMGRRIEITAFNTEDSDEELSGVSFGERTQGPWAFYQFTVILAFLALPAVTSYRLENWISATTNPRGAASRGDGRSCLQDCVVVAGGLLRVSRSGVLAHGELFDRGAVCATAFVVFDVSLRAAVGGSRSTTALPGLPAARDASGNGWDGWADVPGLEWNRDDLQRRAHAAACSGVADELVQYPSLALSRHVVEVPVHWFQRIRSAHKAIELRAPTASQDVEAGQPQVRIVEIAAPPESPDMFAFATSNSHLRVAPVFAIIRDVMSKQQFQTEVSQLLQLIVHSLYSTRKSSSAN